MQEPVVRPSVRCLPAGPLVHMQGQPMQESADEVMRETGKGDAQTLTYTHAHTHTHTHTHAAGSA